MWLLFSVLTVLLWGTSDVVFKSVSKGRSEATLLAYNGIILGIVSIGYWIIGGYSFQLSALYKYLPIAAVYITSMFCYYRALTLLKLSIASPIANSSCMITSLMAALILGQVVDALKWAAIAAIVISIVLISVFTARNEEEGQEKKKASLRGIFWALLYFLLDGVGSFLDDYALEETLSESDVLISYGLIYMLIGFIALAVAIRQKSLIKDYKIVLGGLVETAGQFTYIYAFAFGDSVIASPFIASFSAVSVLLSRIFLKEKLNWKIYALIALIIASMAVLSY